MNKDNMETLVLTFILQRPSEGYYVKSNTRGKSDSQYQAIHLRIKKLGLETLGCICAGEKDGQIQILNPGEHDLSKAVLLSKKEFHELFVID